MAKTNEEIKEMGKFYVENDVTYDEAAKKFGVSKRSFQLYMKKLKEISKEDYILVQNKKQINIKLGSIKGGSISRTDSLNVGRKRHINDDDLDIYTDRLLKGDLSIRQLSKDTEIPKSTLYDNITKRNTNPDKKVAIDNLFYEHKPENNKKGK